MINLYQTQTATVKDTKLRNFHNPVMQWVNQFWDQPKTDLV